MHTNSKAPPPQWSASGRGLHADVAENPDMSGENGLMIGNGVVADFDRMCSEQLELCDELEALADSLPAADKQSALHIARAMNAILSRAHDFEETRLFPLVSDVAVGDINVLETLERLKYEHYQDNCFAEEVREALIEFSSSRKSLSPDALGYMLRGFFVSLRRHISVEKQLVQQALRHSSNRH